MKMNRSFQYILDDPYLLPYKGKIEERLDILLRKKVYLSLENRSLSDFACGYLYFGLHKYGTQWIFREYAPNAFRIDFIIGQNSENNQWIPKCVKPMTFTDNGNWEIFLDPEDLCDGTLYRIKIYWKNDNAERLPAWCNRVVQDPNTLEYSAQVCTSSHKWKSKVPDTPTIPLIYEAHVGMATEDLKIGTFQEFQDSIIPYIKKAGYNTIQLMGIQEHPYYGSFGYHVSNFFAVSSRFGTPDDLKSLIDTAHSLGMKVIMDLVHSHSVKNELEGLNSFDGDPGLYFYSDERRNHPQWGSLCFNYDKGNVIHFLLSNCKYWLEEFHLDGFRFDGVSSMLYNNHGLGVNFCDYSMYFDEVNINRGAIAYLQLANQLIHELRPDAITIAEEMSGMPGLTSSVEEGGIGFDYRLAMGIPDYWIQTIKECNTADWDTGKMYFELTRKRIEEKTISYVESHDQALVGDQTIIFRLLQKKIYDTMLASNEDSFTTRGIALHKMIRFITIVTAGNGFLNFMGNEFGHPEWIDFPRIGNNWSYEYARRQWSLNNPNLKYYDLGQFDKHMIKFISKHHDIYEYRPILIYQNSKQSVLIFNRSDLYFFFNFGNTQVAYLNDCLELEGQILLEVSYEKKQKKRNIQLQQNMTIELSPISFFVLKNSKSKYS